MLWPLDLFDHVLFVILAVVLGPRALVSFRRLRAAAASGKGPGRPRAYVMAMISQWVLTLALLVHWSLAGRTWTSLGLQPRLTAGALGAAIGLVLMTVVIVLQSRGSEGRERARARVLERIQHVRFIIPHTARELRLFTAVSITAGICEELLYRGFLIAYLSHWMGAIQAALLSSVLFGVAHLYQGMRGILLTGAIGAFMSGIYLVSGSLYLPMIIHAAVDLSSGRAGYDALRAEAESAEPDREAGSA